LKSVAAGIPVASVFKECENLIINASGSLKQYTISPSELLAVIKAASKIPTCVQYSGVLEGTQGWVFCDLHFYGLSTAGCKAWTPNGGPIAYTTRKFKSWAELERFINELFNVPDNEERG
jgi:hypothetical protein